MTGDLAALCENKNTNIVDSFSFIKEIRARLENA